SPTGGSEPGHAELAAHPGDHRVELVEPVEARPGHHVVDLEGKGLGGEQVHRAAGACEGARAPDGVVDLADTAVEADLYVEVVRGRDPARGGPVDQRAVGAELDSDPVVDGVLHQLEEVGPGHGLAAPDVDVEDLHLRPAVKEAPRVLGGQLVGRALARAGEAVDAAQVARVRHLPGQAD